MRCWIFFLLSFSISFTALAQNDNFGRPKITGQSPISTDEEQPVVIKLSDLEVRDRDDWFYPYGFTMRVYEGNNYTFSGLTITPAKNFSGTLSVLVSVNDGKQDSEIYNLQIQVRPLNDPPTITGQAILTTNEEQAISLNISHLAISDPDDTQFTMIVSEGQNYTTNVLTITPVQNFNGVLQVAVRASDGKALSDLYTLQVTVSPVNDVPKITGQVPLEVEENKPLSLQLSQLTVTDPDNTYPTGFTLSILTGNNYTFSGSQFTPSFNFEGMLSVNVMVNDGSANSEPFTLQVKVFPSKNGPTITGQSPMPITTNEDQPITILFSHLTVSDPDNNYPNGFTLHILPGTNYTVVGNVVTPLADYHGNVSVNVSVNDGTSESNVYGLSVSVRPVNDAPKISKIETEPLVYRPNKTPAPITQVIEITDVDNDSLWQAEINFKPETFRFDLDELLFETRPGIKGAFDRQRGTLIFSGRAPKAEYVLALKSIKYRFIPGADLPFETKTIVMSVSDGKIVSEKVERQIKSTDVIVDLNIPTAFTPNGDRANDTWSIKPLKPSDELANAIVRIYNKSGRLLFEAEGFEKEWDGRLNGEVLPADTYYYTIDLNLEYSRTLFKGLVTILR